MVILLSAFRGRILDDVANGQDCRTVMMMPLQFASTAVMLEDVSLDGGSVIVMLLLFAFTVCLAV